jgi:transcriptional regulator with XRE-family HTH domain
MTRSGDLSGAELAALADRIKRVRERLGQSQVDFANATGVSRSYLSEMESGKAKPSVALVIGVTQAFPEINRDWLISGSGIMATWDNVDTTWEAGLLRLYSDVTLKNADPDALRTAVYCLDKVQQKKNGRFNGDEEQKYIITFYELYIGAYQNAMQADATKADPRSYARGYCQIKAGELPHWDDGAPRTPEDQADKSV